MVSNRQPPAAGRRPSIALAVAWARRRRLLVLGLAAGLLVVASAGMARLRFDTDIISLLPHEGRAIPAFRDFLRHFGGFDHLYVVFSAPRGHRIGEFDAEIEAWVQALRDVPEIARVDSGTLDATRDWAWLADRQLLLLGDARLDSAIARLQPDGVRDAVLESRGLLAVPSPELTNLVRQDPLGLLSLLRDELGQTQAGLNLGGGPDGYTTSDGTRRLVIARPTRPPYDTTFSRALFTRLDHLRQARRSAAPRDDDGDMWVEPRPALDVAFAGGHRIAIETEQIVRRESITNSLGSLALILPLLFAVYRSAWLVAIGAIPSALALVLVLGVLGFSGATLSAAASAAAAMMFGLGVDGVVLLYATHRRAVSSGATDAEVDRRVGAASASMLLGMWTTAATFYGLMLVDFPSLTQLGTLVGHSMAVCGLLTLLLVPALLPRRSRRADAPSRARAVAMPRLAASVLRHRRILLVAAAIATVVLALLAGRVRINPTLERLRSVSAGAQFEIEIARAFGLPDESYVVLASGRDLQTLLAGNERLVEALRRRLPALPVHAPSMLLPSAARQSAVRARIARELPPAAEIAAAIRREGAAAGFKPGTFAPFELRLGAMTSPAAELTPGGFAAHGLGDLLQRFVTRAGDTWLLATYLFPSTPAEASAMAEIVASHPLGGATLTGLPLVNGELAAAFIPQFLQGLLIGGLAVIVLILLSFRDWRLSALALAPTAIGLLWGAGILGALQAELDLFALFTVVTFIGIGVDYGVHLVHRYVDAGNIYVALSELAPVILVAGAITVFGYGTLVTSSYPPLRSMGLVSIISVVSLVAASVIVLPGLLAWLESSRE